MTTTTCPPDDRLDADIHGWFGLSYSNYLVVDHAATSHMPEEWRTETTGMLDELRRAFSHIEVAHEYVVVAGWEYEFGDLDDDQMRKADVATNAEHIHDGCEHANPDDDTFDCERENLRWYDWRGDEWDRHQYLIVPAETDGEARQQKREVVHRSLLQSMPREWQARLVALMDAVTPSPALDAPGAYEIRCFDAAGARITDPVPHYNRGRTYIEPRIEPAEVSA